MVHIIIEISKYLMIALILMYTILCFSVFNYSEPDKKRSLLRTQNIQMYLIHLLAYLIMYLETEDMELFVFYFMQVILFAATIFLSTHIYPRISRTVLNNMCMLLCIGFIMLTRLNYNKAFKQFIIASGAILISLLIPVIIRKIKILSDLRVFYGVVGIVSLGIVAVLGQVSYGAKLGFTLGGISIQPSELVKIIFVFFVAASFKKSMAFKDIVITTIIAALHVLILVASRDLGAALIIFVVYLTMLFVATHQPLYIVAGLGSGAIASVGAYYLFSHVQTRVNVWRDPFANYDEGYQVAQSLFAIGSGGWFGRGLYQGSPETIPVADEDFIFSALSEEMGIIFAFCVILICLSCYIMFLNIAMQHHNLFYKMVALGLGTCFVFQAFLNIGGVTKFIPSTGVTLPFVSYGGSSLLSTFIMFAIIQGLYILREDEDEELERKRKERIRKKLAQQEAARRQNQTF